MTEVKAGPTAAAGWYPDPEQVDTVRYWDGAEWTDQRAPKQAAVVPPPGPSSGVTSRAILGGLGGLLAIVGVFLPMLDSSTSLHIVDNSVISQDALVGILAILFGVAAISGSWQYRADPRRYWMLSILGLLLILGAIYQGTGERTELKTTATGLLAEQTSKGSAGVGLYAIGAGGALIVLAGLATSGRKRDTLPEQSNGPQVR